MRAESELDSLTKEDRSGQFSPKWKFLKQFLISPSVTGAVASSSEDLATLIVGVADIPHMQSVVELGSGTGIFTEKILHRLNNSAVFFALEVNPYFVQETLQRCPAATVYQDSVSNLREHLDRHHVDRCDCIISSLPWAGFGNRKQETFLQTVVDVLKPEGKFLAFAYIHTLLMPSGRTFRTNLFEKFGKVVTTKTVWKNLPPAFVYACRK